MNRDDVRRAVREALERELARGSSSERAVTRPTRGSGSSDVSGPPEGVSRSHRGGFRPSRVVTEKDVLERIERGESLDFAADSRLTALARETLERYRRRPPDAREPASGEAPPRTSRGPRDTVAVGSDHGGFSLKETIKRHLLERGFGVEDQGTHSPDACDYPVFARKVGRAVRHGDACVGIVVDGAGIGSAMTANKMSGIRAALCHNVVEARNAREHNHANVLTLGAGIVGETLALAVVDAFLSTPFGGGRHARRVSLIEDERGEIHK